jgi:hypothetical protein
MLPQMISRQIARCGDFEFLASVETGRAALRILLGFREKRSESPRLISSGCELLCQGEKVDISITVY